MNPAAYPWWLAARAAGVVAYLLLSLSVAGGLVMAMRMAPVRLRTALRQAHERIALLALAATGAHGLLLLGDPWLHAAAWNLVVPFSLGYRPVWTGLGVLAAALAAALSLTFYARKRLGSRRWRRAHRVIPVAWALAAAHVVGAGTDGLSLWLLAPTAVTIAVALWLLGERWLRPAPPVPAPRPKAKAKPRPVA